jgi:2-polyprenyl-6-hydroxyphenyl methylase/3-demethylubiquinone-9 3-methyltransferase
MARKTYTGRVWKKYAKHISEKHVVSGVSSLKRLTGLDTFQGRSFLCVGCAGGLMAVAAARLGAQRVVGVDPDPQSIEATHRAFRQIEGEMPGNVELREGDVLDPEFMNSLGEFDIVYSWGFLHHTGQMWHAMDLVTHNVASGGLLAMGIYNRMWLNGFWLRVKKFYNWAFWPIRFPMALSLFGLTAGARILRGRHPFRKRSRGMSVWYDTVEWLGGVPYEWASEGEVCGFLKQRGLALVKFLPVAGFKHGCNQMLFKRAAVSPSSA